jgi:hypothetical protein
MAAALAVILSLLLASPVTGALTLPQIAALAGIALKGLPAAIKTERQLIAYLNSPQFRAMAAANGEAAIKWQDRQMEK